MACNIFLAQLEQPNESEGIAVLLGLGVFFMRVPRARDFLFMVERLTGCRAEDRRPITHNQLPTMETRNLFFCDFLQQNLDGYGSIPACVSTCDELME